VYAVLGGMAFGALVGAIVWVANSADSEMAGVGGLVLLGVVGAVIGSQVGLVAGLAFLGVAALLRPAMPTCADR
jgi:hypothetical protein